MIPTKRELLSDYWRESCMYWGDTPVVGSAEQLKNNFAQDPVYTQPIYTAPSAEHVNEPPPNILNTILNRLEVELNLFFNLTYKLVFINAPSVS
jgi:hypothetical protein